MRRLLAISFAIPVALMLQAGSVEASGQSGDGASGVGVFALVAAVALMALFVIGMARVQRRSKGS
jgi:hypothetical protein